MRPFVLLLSLPILTGVAMALYERITLKSGLSVGQYVAVSNLAYLVPVLIWCIVRGEFIDPALGPNVVAFWRELVVYSGLSVLISVGWWFSSRLSGVAHSSAFESSYPMFVLLFSAIFNGRTLKVREVVAMLAVMLGLTLLQAK